MFVLPAIAALLAFVFLRLHEVVEVLRPLTINVLVAVIVLAYVLDVRLGFVRPRGSPLLVLILGMFSFSVFSLLVKAPTTFGHQILILGTSLIAFLAVSEGVQTFRALGVVAGVLVALTLALALMGVYQGFQPKICYLRGSDLPGDPAGEIVDGRPCEKRAQCNEGGVFGGEYLCEHPGLLGTRSIGGRVRYRGLLEDPNELCFALAMGAPLALGLYERRRTLRRLLLALTTFAASTVCAIMTHSRSGQASILAVLGVSFMRRFGRRGVVVSAVLGVPLLILGGRTGAEADSSSRQRLECWAAALSMWRENPFMGVGQGQFTQRHFLTAHNSFLLTLAELGPLGLVLFTATVYFAFKIALRAQVELADRPEAAVARSWATAIMASLAGMTVSAFFLSVPYNVILWIFLALAGSFYAAVRRHAPNWRVRFGFGDLVVVVMADAVIVVGLQLYTRLKGV
jgi:O-Antigen ligase